MTKPPQSRRRLVELPPGLSTLRRMCLPRKLGLLERFYGRALASHGVDRVECSNGVHWKLDLRGPTHRWVVYGDYEGSRQMEWVRRWLASGGVFVDSGANIGQMLLYVASIQDVRVIAFEPEPEAFEWLRECVAQYAETWSAQLVRKGLSDRKEQIPLQRSGERSTMRTGWYKGKGLKHCSVEVDTLDRQLSQLGVTHVRLWKLDVEGFEPEALKGASRLLARSSIDAILVVISSGCCDPVQELLTPTGYCLYSLSEQGKLVPSTQKTVETRNFIALSHRVRTEMGYCFIAAKRVPAVGWEISALLSRPLRCDTGLACR